MVEAYSNLPQNRRNYAPNEALLESLENEHYRQMLEISKKRLAPDSAVEDLDQYFVCTICQNVVEEPAECQECNDLCCSECLA